MDVPSDAAARVVELFERSGLTTFRRSDDDSCILMYFTAAANGQPPIRLRTNVWPEGRPVIDFTVDNGVTFDRLSGTHLRNHAQRVNATTPMPTFHVRDDGDTMSLQGRWSIPVRDNLDAEALRTTIAAIVDASLRCYDALRDIDHETPTVTDEELVELLGG